VIKELAKEDRIVHVDGKIYVPNNQREDFIRKS